MYKNFKIFCDCVADNINGLQKGPLFVVNVDNETLWEMYLDAFPYEELREEHDCPRCHEFFQTMGNVVGIKDEHARSIFYMDYYAHKLSPLYIEIARKLAQYIQAQTVETIFVSAFKKVGIKENQNKGAYFPHFYADIEDQHILKYGDLELMKNFKYLKQAIETITIDGIDKFIQLSQWFGRVDSCVIMAVRDLLAIKWENIYHNRMQKYKQIDSAMHPMENTNEFALRKAQEKPECAYFLRKFIPRDRIPSEVDYTRVGKFLVNLSTGMDLTKAMHNFEMSIDDTPRASDIGGYLPKNKYLSQFRYVNEGGRIRRIINKFSEEELRTISTSYENACL